MSFTCGAGEYLIGRKLQHMVSHHIKKHANDNYELEVIPQIDECVRCGKFHSRWGKKLKGQGVLWKKGSFKI